MRKKIKERDSVKKSCKETKIFSVKFSSEEITNACIKFVIREY